MAHTAVEAMGIAGTSIDDFNDAVAQSVTATDVTPTDSDASDHAGALGGERDLIATLTSGEAGDMSIFRHLPEHVEIGLGCVSCQPGQIDSADRIVERVEMALKHVAPSRITLNPDCGFAPGSAAEVSLDEVYTKLKNEVEAARRLREKYG